MRARHHAPKHHTSWPTLLVMVLAAGAAAWYIVFTQRGIDIMNEASAAQSVRTISKAQKQLELDDGGMLYIPTPDVFLPNRSWMYVSKTTPLANGYQPANLSDIPVATGASDGPMKLRADVNKQLTGLFKKASDQGYPLMVSSAYRSVDDQKKLYDEFVADRGEAAAKQYVLTPGTSEHHTGYAVDVTDASTGCQQDTDKCNLSVTSATWLAEHAPEYGFIIRYPGGKEPLTGIAHEPWHLRYVGVVLAHMLTKDDMTFDEFIAQVAPGRVK